MDTNIHPAWRHDNRVLLDMKQAHPGSHQSGYLCAFGMVTDIQYADLPDGTNWNGTQKRYFRHSLKAASRAFTAFASHAPRKLEYVIHGGDMIDITNVAAKLSDVSLDHVFAALRAYPYPNDVHMLIGNHELYNHKRATIFNRYGRGFLSQAKLSTELPATTSSIASTETKSTAAPAATAATHHHHESKHDDVRWRDPHTMYYDFTPHPHVRCIVLDCFDLSTLGVDGPEIALADDQIIEEHDHVRLARSLLTEKNTHHRGLWYDSNHLPKGRVRRWASYNGGISDTQLRWMDGILADALFRHQIVIIYAHVPLHASNKWDAVIWNFPQMLERLRRAPHVVACFQGHVHEGDYHYVAEYAAHPHHHTPATAERDDVRIVEHSELDEAPGIHFVTFRATLICPDGTDTYGIGYVYPDHLQLNGFDRQPTRHLKYSDRAMRAVGRTTPLAAINRN